MKDPLKSKQHKRKDGLKFFLTFILVLSITGIVVIKYMPQEAQELPNPRMDFDDQDTINRNGNTWNIDEDTITEGKPIEFNYELEKDI